MLSEYSPHYKEVFEKYFAQIIPLAEHFDNGELTKKDYNAQAQQLASITAANLRAATMAVSQDQADNQALGMSMAGGMTNYFNQQAAYYNQQALQPQPVFVPTPLYTRPPQQRTPINCNTTKSGYGMGWQTSCN